MRVKEEMEEDSFDCEHMYTALTIELDEYKSFFTTVPENLDPDHFVKATYLTTLDKLEQMLIESQKDGPKLEQVATRMKIVQDNYNRAKKIMETRSGL